MNDMTYYHSAIHTHIQILHLQTCSEYPLMTFATIRQGGLTCKVEVGQPALLGNTDKEKII